MVKDKSIDTFSEEQQKNETPNFRDVLKERTTEQLSD